MSLLSYLIGLLKQHPVFALTVITFIPVLELRASIPLGISVLGKESWLFVFTVCIIANIIIGAIIFVLLDKIVRFVKKAEAVNVLYNKYVERTQRKMKPLVEKYGELAVAVFIGVPLPGTGVYSGALGAYVIGLNFKKFIIADIIGVLIAGILVTIAILTGIEAFQFFIKRI